MSLKTADVLARIERLSVSSLETWVAAECVRPVAAEEGPAFTEADVARLRLICMLRDDFDITEDTLPMVLSLIDQLHGVRRALRDLAQAVEQQPAEVRREIARALRATGKS